MSSSRITQLLLAGLAALAAASVSAAPVRILFSTGATSVAGADLSSALTNAGIAVGGAVTGEFFYDDSTVGTATTAFNTNYDGAIDSLSFSVAGWFSQSVVMGAAANGDIRVRDNSNGNGTAAGNSDNVQVLVQCAPQASGLCAANPQNFTYSFLDPVTNVRWTLDQFTLLLSENVAATQVLTSMALPTEAQWESTSWTVRSVTLRFNPLDSTGAITGNQTATSTITFLAVPEPSGLALAGVALIAMGWGTRRRQRR